MRKSDIYYKNPNSKRVVFRNVIGKYDKRNIQIIDNE